MLDLKNTAVLLEVPFQWRTFASTVKDDDRIFLPRAKIDTFPSYVRVEPVDEKLVLVPGLSAEEVRTKGLFVLSLMQFQKALKEMEGEKQA